MARKQPIHGPTQHTLTRRPGLFRNNPAPGRRSDTYHTPEDPGEVRLVVESTAQGNFAQRFAGRQHHLVCSLYAISAQIAGWRLAHGATERAGKVTLTHPNRARHIIECDDLDEAIDVASRHPVARFGSIEVRPFWTE